MTRLRPLNVSVLQFSFCKKRDSSGQPCEDSVKKCLHHAQRSLAWGAVSANAGCNCPQPCPGGAGGSELQTRPYSCPVWQKTPGLGQGDVSSNLLPPRDIPGACPSPGQQCHRGQVLGQLSVGPLLPALWMMEPCGRPMLPSPRAEASLAQGSEWAGL